MKKIGFWITLAFALSVSCIMAFAAGPAVLGDVNGDGNVDALDFAQYRLHLLGRPATFDVSVADLDGDGSPTAIDFAHFRKYLLGMIEVFPASGKVTPTPTEVVSTPTPTTAVVDPEAWKSNTGTINLGSTITYTGEGISVDGTTINITSGGDHEVTGTLTDGMIYVSTTERVKLRLSGVNMSNSDGPAIYFAETDKAFITVTADTENFISDGTTYTDEDANGAIFSNDTLEIKGKGTLNITSNYAHGIACDDNISINNSTINITAVKDGLHANDEIEIEGGSIYVEAGSDGIDAGQEINISGGTIVLIAGKLGLTSETELIISAGTIISTGDYVLEPSPYSTQASMYVSLGSTQPAGTIVNVSNTLTFAPANSYKQLFFSSPDLTSGVTYDINIGGTSTATPTYNGIYDRGVYTPGTTNLEATAK